MDERNPAQEDLVRLLRNLEDKIAPIRAPDDIQVPDDALAMREDDIKAAIALWEQGRNKTDDAPRDAAPIGRANGLDLLRLAAAVLQGEEPLSPALAAWFTGCVQAIGEGANPDDAFCAKARIVHWNGADVDMAERDWLVRQVCEKEIANGLKPGGLEEDSPFDRVAQKLPSIKAGTARNCYYNFETIEEIFFDPPQIAPKKDES